MTRDSYDARAATPEGRLGLAQAGARYRAVELIAEVLHATDVSQRELAGRLGRTESAVSQVLGGDRNLTLNTLVEYLHALGHDLELEARPWVDASMHRVDGLADVIAFPTVVAQPTVTSPYRIRSRA